MFCYVFKLFSLFQRKRKRKLEDDGDTISLQSFDSAGKVIVWCLSEYVPACRFWYLLQCSAMAAFLRHLTHKISKISHFV